MLASSFNPLAPFAPSQLSIYWPIVVEGILVSLALGLLGCFLVVRGLSLLGDALSHSVLPGIVIGLIFSFVGPHGWQSALIGAALGAGVLYAIAAAYYMIRREEGLGMGDVKMLAMIGAFLGWQAVLVTLVLSSFAGALVGIGLMAFQRGNMKLALPFGTFLAMQPWRLAVRRVRTLTTLSFARSPHADEMR